MQPAVFLDRDGTINVEVDYLHRVEDVALIPGSGKAIARLNALGIPVVVVTNQSGIGRGRFGWAEFDAVTARVAELLALEGARVDGTYVAPHHEKGKGEYAVADHPDRKPNPGMLQRAAADLGLDLARSWMVGDKDSDIEAGRSAGCRTILVRTGYGDTVRRDLADFVADDLANAVNLILEHRP